jgi:N-acyl-D-amino-acid deacylase
VHSHADRGIEDMPDAGSQIAQGITTAVVGQDGSSTLPVSDLFDLIDEVRPAINFATSIGHGTIRSAVLGADFRRTASAAEIETMRMLVDRGMKDGAIGLSSGLEYDPGFHSSTDELVALASVVAPYGGLYSTHVRDEEKKAFAAWAEAIEIGRRARVPVQISHIKLAAMPVWGRAREALALLERAKADGVDVTADWYPYTFWQSSLYVLNPAIRDVTSRAKWEVGLAETGGPGNVLVTSYRPDPSYDGKTIEQIARLRGQDPVTAILAMIEAAGPNIGIIGTSMDESDLEAFVSHPQVIICSDGGLSGRHPRGYGAFPRVIARYVRERKVLPLSEAIAKMTGRTATKLGLTDRGIVAPGKKADLVLFDAARLADHGTRMNAAQAPTGLSAVLVNGEVALENGRATGARAGRALRKKMIG